MFKNDQGWEKWPGISSLAYFLTEDCWVLFLPSGAHLPRTSGSPLFNVLSKTGQRRRQRAEQVLGLVQIKSRCTSIPKWGSIYLNLDLGGSMKELIKPPEVLSSVLVLVFVLPIVPVILLAIFPVIVIFLLLVNVLLLAPLFFIFIQDLYHSCPKIV